MQGEDLHGIPKNKWSVTHEPGTVNTVRNNTFICIGYTSLTESYSYTKLQPVDVIQQYYNNNHYQ